MGIDNRIEAYHIGARYPIVEVLLIMRKSHVTSVQTASGLALAS